MTDSKTIDDKKKEFIVPGLSGLVNFGNTCYVNSIIQCLSASLPFLVYIISNEFECRLNKNVANKDDSVTFRLSQILKKMWDCNGNYTITPKLFKETMGKKFTIFNNNDQNDSHEYLNALLDQIHEELKSKVEITKVETTDFETIIVDIIKNLESELNPEEKIINNDMLKELIESNRESYTSYLADQYWKSCVSKAHSVIIDIFTGMFYTTITCDTCKNATESFANFTIMTLPIQNHTTIQECLKTYTLEETLSGQNAFYCSNCKKNGVASKGTYIWSLPNVLIIQLGRFDNVKSYTTKVTTKVTFPVTDLDMSDYLKVKQNVKYDLCAVSSHSGTITNGHYISYCKNPINNMWYEYNDSVVNYIPTESLTNKIVTNSAYILFYVKK